MRLGVVERCNLDFHLFLFVLISISCPFLLQCVIYEYIFASRVACPTLKYVYNLLLLLLICRYMFLVLW